MGIEQTMKQGKWPNYRKIGCGISHFQKNRVKLGLKKLKIAGKSPRGPLNIGIFKTA